MRAKDCYNTSAMDTIYGSNNWKLTFLRMGEGVTVLRALTCDTDAALPESLGGAPVTALGARALAPDAPSTQGEELTIVGAPCSAEWDNRALRTLALPPRLRSVGDYALMNCRALKAVRLSDLPISWGTGVLMN
ncbi:MAG: hypothetical protein J5449_11075, partial [Oscillospiraceae bacterium]|nr:hypothetical protein [Oscillospiraceae bacterium]